MVQQQALANQQQDLLKQQTDFNTKVKNEVSTILDKTCTKDCIILELNNNHPKCPSETKLTSSIENCCSIYNIKNNPTQQQMINNIVKDYKIKYKDIAGC